MLVNVDAKALEVLCAAYLSSDKILCQEIIDGVDIHSVNQEAFNLPDRLIAKKLQFRILYGGTEYSFAQDPEFTCVSSSQVYWKKAIDKFYEKYSGLAKWHTNLIATASSTGKIVMPTGRFYKFTGERRNGDIVWPRTQILNYPVQGFGADLMTLARVSFFRRFKEAKIKGELISTIHDSIVVDVPNEEVEKVCIMFEDVFADIPKNFERIFGIPFHLPTKCEVEYGHDKFNLTKYTRDGTIVY